VAGDPRFGGLVAGADRAADEFGQHRVLALDVEVEVEAGTRDWCGGQDVGHGELVEAALGTHLEDP